MKALDQFPDIRRLNVDARLQLIEEIWDTIAADEEQSPLSEALKEELDRRIADMESNPDDEMTWDEVKASIRAKQ